MVDMVAKLLTEKWENLTQEEIEQRRAASLTKIQNLFITKGMLRDYHCLCMFSKQL
jgi:hypothetical protein